MLWWSVMISTRISPSCFVHQRESRRRPSSSIIPRVARIRWLVQSFGWLLGSEKRQNWWLFMGRSLFFWNGGTWWVCHNKWGKSEGCKMHVVLFVSSWFFFISGTFTHSLHSDMCWYVLICHFKTFLKMIHGNGAGFGEISHGGIWCTLPETNIAPKMDGWNMLEY